MKITFWGTRGSVPVSGPSHAYFGGATTCIAFEDERGRTAPIIIDSGTGIVRLGQKHPQLNKATIYQTHMHWDHIQGFPFFSPLFNPAHQFDYCAVARGGECIREVLSNQMTQPTFPVTLDIIHCTLNFTTLPEQGSRTDGLFEVQWMEMNHPGGSSAFRLTLDDVSVVFTGDMEARQGCREALIDFARGADILIMDAQYTAQEYQQRIGFGHSTPEDAVDVAYHARIQHVFLTHHDPSHSDHQIHQMVHQARQYAQHTYQVPMSIEAARDGQSFMCQHRNQPHHLWFEACENAHIA